MAKKSMRKQKNHNWAKIKKKTLKKAKIKKNK